MGFLLNISCPNKFSAPFKLNAQISPFFCFAGSPFQIRECTYSNLLKVQPAVSPVHFVKLYQWIIDTHSNYSSGIRQILFLYYPLPGGKIAQDGEPPMAR
jgi:hypothetical protein